MDDQTFTDLSPAVALLWIAISVVISLIVALTRNRLAARQQYWIDNARWVLIPYIALLLGHLSPRLMGLTEINWLNSISIGAGFIGIVVILLSLVLSRNEFVRAEPISGPVSGLIPDQPQGQPDSARHATDHNWTTNTWTTTDWTMAQFVVASATEQFHWAFLRGALWEAFLRVGYSAMPAAYMGIWIGGLVAALEMMFHKRNTAQRLVDLTTLLLTSILFFYTRNFWLCWALHLLITMLLRPQVSAVASRP